MLAFHGLRVLDFTHVLAGPFAAYQLALGGAEVIKVEQPDGGDMVRPAGGPEQARRAGLGYAFLAQNANKKSIILDLEDATDRTVAKRLALGADVVIENYRTGVLDGFGLGFEALKATNPTLIYCSMSGFGPDGPHGLETAYDNVIQAVSGLMSLTPDAAGAPRMVGAPLLDYGTGYAAAFAVASALLRRERCGLGQRIDFSMMDVALSMMSALTMRVLNDEPTPGRPGNISANAGYGCYPAQDGLVMIGAYSVEQSVRLWRLLDQEEEAATTETLRLDQLPDRHETQRRLLSGILPSRPVAYWVDRLQRGGVPAGPVQSLGQAVASDYASARPLLTTPIITVPGVGPVHLLGPAFRCDADSPAVVAPPPALDADGAAIRRALREGDGWSAPPISSGAAPAPGSEAGA